MRDESHAERLKLFHSHMMMAYKFANKLYLKGGYQREDIAQEALMLLWKATETFDPKKASFTTYAYTKLWGDLKKIYRPVRFKLKEIGSSVEIRYDEDRKTIKRFFAGKYDYKPFTITLINSLKEKIKNPMNWEIYFMRVMDDKEWPEIGREFGISQQAVHFRFKKLSGQIQEIL